MMKPLAFDSSCNFHDTSQGRDVISIQVCGGTGCNAQGSNMVYEAFSHELSENGLADRVLLSTTGCHGFCERGPIVSIKPSGILYLGVMP